MAAATRLGCVIHPSCITGEVRQIVSEHKKEMEGNSLLPKGLSSRTLDQLKAKCMENGWQYHSNRQRVTCSSCCARSLLAPADRVVTFGRHRRNLYREVPLSYLQWSVEETKPSRQLQSRADPLGRLCRAERKIPRTRRRFRRQTTPTTLDRCQPQAGPRHQTSKLARQGPRLSEGKGRGYPGTSSPSAAAQHEGQAPKQPTNAGDCTGRGEDRFRT